jgi:hypothetical protein
MEERCLLDASSASPGFLQVAQQVLAQATPSASFQAGQKAAQSALNTVSTAATNNGGSPAGARAGTDLAIVTLGAGVAPEIIAATAEAGITLLKGSGAIAQQLGPKAGAATFAGGLALLAAAIDETAFVLGAVTVAVNDAVNTGSQLAGQVASTANTAAQKINGANVQAASNLAQSLPPPPTPSQLTQEQQLQLLNQILLGSPQTPTPTPTPGTDPSDNDFDSDTVDTGAFVPDDAADANGTS